MKKALSLLLFLCALLFSFSACNPVQEETPKGPCVSLCFNMDFDTLAGEVDVREYGTLGQTAPLRLMSDASGVHSPIGWFLVNEDGSAGEAWDPVTPLTGDVKLMCMWELRTYTVHYAIGNKEYASLSVYYGEKAEDLFPYDTADIPAAIRDEWVAVLDGYADEGKTFSHWKTDYQDVFDFDTDTIVADTVLYAVFVSK